MNEELKEKWGGSLPQVGDWVCETQSPSKHIKRETGKFSFFFNRLCAPIPLTREVFENIGESKDGWLPLLEDHFDVSFQGNACMLTICDEWGILPFGPQIKYLHQLQWLYRFFKRKELTYTPSRNSVSNSVSKD